MHQKSSKAILTNLRNSSLHPLISHNLSELVRGAREGLLLATPCVDWRKGSVADVCHGDL